MRELLQNVRGFNGGFTYFVCLCALNQNSATRQWLLIRPDGQQGNTEPGKDLLTEVMPHEHTLQRDE